MTIQKVEDSIIGNRQFMLAVIHDLENVYGYRGYKQVDTLVTIQRKEGSLDVVKYLKRKYVNG